MNLNKFWGIILVAFLQFILGTILILGVSSFLSQQILEIIADNAYIHALFLAIFFVISFSTILFIWRKNTTNKTILAKKFFLVYFVFYIFNPIFTGEFSSILVAFLFPFLALFLTQLVVIERPPTT